MKLVTIDYQKVLADCKDGTSTKFNNAFQPQDRLPAAVPCPSEAPYSFSRWLPLILETRGLDSGAAQVIKLQPAQAKLLLEASKASIITRKLNRTMMEDIQDEVFPGFSSLSYPPDGLFMRLNGCSPKDGRRKVPGQLSVHDVEDIILLLTTSQRACNEMAKELEAGFPTIDITFLPFNRRMDSTREYRVYCAPSTCVITAVSQYCWHKPWHLADRGPEEMKAAVSEILDGITKIHGKILEELDPTNRLDVLLLEQGFTFDVFYDEDERRSELVELNVFGARSGCGSCLFDWVDDFRLLYGEKEEVEFRVTSYGSFDGL